MKYNLLELKKALLKNSQEVIPSDQKQLEAELEILIQNAHQSGQKIRHYIGFEISGKVHIGTGIASALKIKKLTDCGVECYIWLADYHTWINNKLDGKLETARKIARQYFAPVMLKCMEVVGCNMDLIKILYAQEEYEKKKNNHTFFDFDLIIAKNLTLSRVLKSISIAGKKDGEGVEFATLRYPAMQVADAFFLGAHIVHAGMDQRKAHVLMREVSSRLENDYALKIANKRIPPIAVHHELLLSLSKPKEAGGQERMRDELYEDNKMSKSKPDSAVFVHDLESEIKRKIKNAYCPMIDKNLSNEENQKIQVFNPLLDWSKKMIFPGGQVIQVNRPEKFGGNIKFENYQDLEKSYFEGKLHPMDLKNGVAQTLINWFAPICTFVQENPQILEGF
jgi:tyrosyl-tRNA synthetase